MSINCIRTLIEDARISAPDKIALIDGERQITYFELFEKVNQVAGYLTGLDLPRGSRIGIYSHKTLDQVIAILALVSTEYMFVPISRLLKPEQVEHIITDCEIGCLITDSKKIKSIDEIEYNGTIITYEPVDPDLVSFEEIYKCCSKQYECNIGGHTNAAITYSFGSSGFPKGIVMTHRNLIDNARVAGQYLDIREDDVISGVLPLILDYGLNQVFTSLYRRSTLSLHSFALAGDFFSHIIHDSVTVIALMPPHITRMFDDPDTLIPNPRLLEKVRIITSSGGKVSTKMIQDIAKYFPTSLFYSMHGLIEAFRSAYLDPKQLAIRPNSIGKPIPDVELYVINEQGEACKPREVGELIHRGGYIYKGYWNAQEETEKRFKTVRQVLNKIITIEEGLTEEYVICTGDLVYTDEEGYLYYVSRKDELMIVSGFRISPYEIESVVHDSLPLIKDCVVFSLEDENAQEQIILVYTANTEIPRNELLFELKKHLPNHMIPTEIIYKDRLPTLSQGKIDRDGVKKEVEREM